MAASDFAKEIPGDQVKPKLTIGMPVHNGENFLDEALSTLLNQSFTDFELIISDNASTDDTENIVRRHMCNDQRVKYQRHTENIGAIGNFNCLVDIASGEFFKWASHDDVCDSEFLHECIAALENAPDALWCHCESDQIDAEGNSWLERMPADDEEIEIDQDGRRSWKGIPREHHAASSPSQRFAGVLLGTRWCVDSYGVFRTEALRKTRMLQQVYGSEKVLMGELSLLGKMVHVPKLLFRQRVHEHASSYRDDAEAQRLFASGNGQKRVIFSARLALCAAHWGAIRHVPLGFTERAKCYWVLARYLCQTKKWGRILRSSAKRRSVGGGGKRIIEACQNDEVDSAT